MLRIGGSRDEQRQGAGDAGAHPRAWDGRSDRARVHDTVDRAWHLRGRRPTFERYRPYRLPGHARRHAVHRPQLRADGVTRGGELGFLRRRARDHRRGLPKGPAIQGRRERSLRGGRRTARRGAPQDKDRADDLLRCGVPRGREGARAGPTCSSRSPRTWSPSGTTTRCSARPGPSRTGCRTSTSTRSVRPEP